MSYNKLSRIDIIGSNGNEGTHYGEIKTMNIKDMVKDKKVVFLYYQSSELWYTTECGFDFPVPISDTGDAKFERDDKAIIFMRWINKQIKVVESYAL